MYKITDIESLGTEYNIEDKSGTIVKAIKIITHIDILNAALGPYTEEFGDYASYLEKSCAVLSGNDDIDITDILWYSTTDEEVPLADIIQHAVVNDYNIVILEHLEDIE